MQNHPLTSPVRPRRSEPIGELRRIFDVSRPCIPYYNLRQVDARVPPLDDWLRGHAQQEIRP